MNKATLQQQIADMEVKLAEMKEELNKPKKFEWSYVDNNTFYISTVCTDTAFSGNSKLYIEHGRYRKTKQAAEMSLARNKRANRLEALAEQLGGLKEFLYGEENYNIIFDINYGEWEILDNKIIYHPEKVYMIQECAIEICRMLNAGEFSLDGEI